MTTPPHGPEPDDPDRPVSLHKAPDEPLDFDPYRFGAPEHPVPPEYAPPGYRPPPQYRPPFAQPQYGPPPPHWSQYPQPRTGNGKAIAALVLGIGSIVFSWLSVLDAGLVIPAIILGIIALGEARQRPRGEGRGMARAGIACAVVGALLAVTLTVYIAREFRDCLHMQVGSSQYNQCIRDHLP